MSLKRSTRDSSSITHKGSSSASPKRRVASRRAYSSFPKSSTTTTAITTATITTSTAIAHARSSSFSKDLTNTISSFSGPVSGDKGDQKIKTARRNSSSRARPKSMVSFQAESVIPFPVTKSCPPSPEKPSKSQTPVGGAELARRATFGTTAKRRVLKDALKEREIALIGNTLNFEALSVHALGGTALNPAALSGMLDKNDVFYHAWVAIKLAIEEVPLAFDDDVVDIGDWRRLVGTAIERLVVSLGKECIDHISGPHVTFIDPRLHDSSGAIVRQAKRMIIRFEEAGVDRSQVVFSIPATENGVQAAKQLETASIQTNLTLVSGLTHAAACVEAGATIATIHIESFLRWFEDTHRASSANLAEHPGVETIQSVIEYFRIHEFSTKLVGSDFRRLSEVSCLGRGLDALSLTDKLLDELQHSKLPLLPLQPHSSAAALRARQAQQPCSLFPSASPATSSSPSSKRKPKGFMSAMSSDTQNMVIRTLHAPLQQMIANMERVEEVVVSEVTRQLALADMDVTKMYRHWRAQMKFCPAAFLSVRPSDMPSPSEQDCDWFLENVWQDVKDVLALEDLEEDLALERAAAAAAAMSRPPSRRGNVDDEDELEARLAQQQLNSDEDLAPLREGIDYF